MGAQVGLYAQSMLGVHTHANIGQGGQIDPRTGLNPQPEVEFGDGSDGDVTIAVNTTLARDMNYNNLTINAVFFFTAGFKFKVKGKLSNSGFVYNNGMNGDPGAAGAGGAGGAPRIVGRKPYASLPTAGGLGGNGVGMSTDVSIGGIAPDIDLVNVALLHEGRLWAGGGGGGGGAVGATPTDGATPARAFAGSKGGNGGNGIYIGGGNQRRGGGGGGGGGGIIEIWASEIDNMGSISADGGAGGTGQEDANAQGGGGGGGGGGAILIFYKTASGGGLGARNVAGGAAGGTLAPGTPGAAGFSYAMEIG